MKMQKKEGVEEFIKDHFRVAIFGSARIKKGDTRYNQVKTLAKMLGEEGIDIVTGGGPGLMQAATAGHNLGMKSSKKNSHSIGLLIKLPHEQKTAEFLNVKKEFNRFSERLDKFMELSNIFVVAPGGIGTTLELFYTLQLIQVEQTCNVPIILLGKMWEPLVKWMKDNLKKNKLIDNDDLDPIFIAKNCSEAIKIIKKVRNEFNNGGDNYCLNYKRYKLN